MAGGDESEWEEIPPEEIVEEDREEGAMAAEGPEVAALEEVEPPRRFDDRSRFATVAGLGFFILGVVLYLLVVVPRDGILAALGATGMALTAATVYFWMAHELRIHPKALTRHMARFIAGPLLGLLALLGLITLIVYIGPAAAPGGWGKVVVVFGLEFGTAASVSLLFYSMLWEE